MAVAIYVILCNVLYCVPYRSAWFLDYVVLSMSHWNEGDDG